MKYIPLKEAAERLSVKEYTLVQQAMDGDLRLYRFVAFQTNTPLREGETLPCTVNEYMLLSPLECGSLLSKHKREAVDIWVGSESGEVLASKNDLPPVTIDEVWVAVSDLSLPDNVSLVDPRELTVKVNIELERIYVTHNGRRKEYSRKDIFGKATSQWDWFCEFVKSKGNILHTNRTDHQSKRDMSRTLQEKLNLSESPLVARRYLLRFDEITRIIGTSDMLDRGTQVDGYTEEYGLPPLIE